MPRLDTDTTSSLLSQTRQEHQTIAGCSYWKTDAGKPHWHLLGPYFRPLHEQLDALSDAAVWAGVAADSNGVQQLMASSRNGDPGLTITCMQRGTDYAAVSVVGDIGLVAIQQLQRHARVLLEDGIHTLVIDLSGVSRCDRRLAPLLGRLQRILRTRQGLLPLTRIPYELRGVLTIGELSDAFAACDTGPDLQAPRRTVSMP